MTKSMSYPNTAETFSFWYFHMAIEVKNFQYKLN